MYCKYCGKKTNSEDSICTNCRGAIEDIPTYTKQKSKIIAGILGIFLGWFGIHDFYLGYIKRGIIHILLFFSFLLFTFLPTRGSLDDTGAFILVMGIMAATIINPFWAITEAILILVGKIDKDGNNIPLKG